MKKISICIPVLNEEKNILFAYEEIINFFRLKLPSYQYEIVFTDNNSKDQTEKIITNICKKDKFVKYLRFKNNLGYDKSIMEGYKICTGDSAIVIDCDLQDPVEIIKEFIIEWEKGHDVVYGIRKKRSENIIITFLRKFFYILMNTKSSNHYPLDAGGFRIIDRKIIKEFQDDNSLFPYMRGITFSLSKNSKGIEYDRNERVRGTSKLGLYNTFTYAINALIEETPIFIRYFGKFAFFLTLITLLFTVFNITNNFYYLPIFKNIILIILSVLSIFLSIIGEYVLRIYLQLKKTKKINYEKILNINNGE
jgi:glycosyltransferase involved in cell wall biosynthesis|tara:strand:+ start:3376 stop:4299 length:924 start_codon:yes stop_codon:yes gene_type:complete